MEEPKEFDRKDRTNKTRIGRCPSCSGYWVFEGGNISRGGQGNNVWNVSCFDCGVPLKQTVFPHVKSGEPIYHLPSGS